MKAPINTKPGQPEQPALPIGGQRGLVWRLAPVVGLTVIAILWLGWQFWTLNVESEHLRTHDLRMVELSGEIIHLDEVLTMSARMSAETLDSRWEDRYRQYEPQLDAAIKESSQLDPEMMGKFVAETDLANQKLVEMENKTFDLVHQKDQHAASGILSSPEYARQKEIYADGMRKLSAAISARANAKMAAQHVRVLMAFITLLCVMAVLFLFCVNLLRSSKRRVEAEYQARQVTEQARNNLAKRVAEATADLTQSQKELTAQREQLKVSEERTRLILESSAEGIFGRDTEGSIGFVNPAACRMLGFTAEELIGQPSHALIHHHRPDGSDYPKEECPMFAAYKHGKASRIDDECPLAQGRYRPAGGIRRDADVEGWRRGRLRCQLHRHHHSQAAGGGVADPAQRPRIRRQRHRDHRLQGRHPVGQPGVHPADGVRARGGHRPESPRAQRRCA